MPRPWISLEPASKLRRTVLLIALWVAGFDVQAAPPAVESAGTPDSDAALLQQSASPQVPADVLREDIDQWLRRELDAPKAPVDPGPGVAPGPAAEAPASPEAASGGAMIRLHSLYGVGQRLIAEFTVAGLRMRAQQGLERVRSQYADLGQPAYVLHAVQWPCVQLQRPDGTLVEACLLSPGADHD
ncbi:hypothetical protein [Bordetella trematum]|uniref:hypothetical protein n=1 Tax=Bordetella trematum TaxID=123899 RepID=UPI0013000C54|nr:hypothetical protein [Bordetella trematum]